MDELEKQRLKVAEEQRKYFAMLSSHKEIFDNQIFEMEITNKEINTLVEFSKSFLMIKNIDPKKFPILDKVDQYLTIQPLRN